MSAFDFLLLTIVLNFPLLIPYWVLMAVIGYGAFIRAWKYKRPSILLVPFILIIVIMSNQVSANDMSLSLYFVIANEVYTVLLFAILITGTWAGQSIALAHYVTSESTTRKKRPWDS